MEIKFFNQALEVFISDLDRPTLAKALRTLDLLEKFGSNLGMPHSKKVADNLFELRVRGKRELRIIYTLRKGEVVILLQAFIKKTQKIAKRHVDLAQKRLNSLD